ncbi:cobalamin biosynthesis protein CobG [Kitasatospora sp. NPDC049285]|uniref:cobalamin biosynthesis protein CobG n=1 Tax=Kitasatospora sp. NPDC049285 TaxID=3157096 RepID=UPI003440D4F9
MPPTPDAVPAPSGGSGAAPVVGTDRDRADACPGALRLHRAEDGHLARLRLPGGLLTARQVHAIADAADALGDGEVEVTSRGNVQLRGLRDDCGAELAARLRTAGLLPSDTHERVRNVVASPLAGLDGLGHGDEVHTWVRELDAALCAARWAAGLSGKFLFAVDDGRGDVAALNADVTLIATGGGRALLRLGRARRGTPVDAPVAAALDAARKFLALARGRAWHVREVQDELPDGAVELPEFAGRPPALGVVGDAVSVGLRFGRADSAQWRLLAEAPASGGPGGAAVRVTPWRGVVVPGAGAGWLERFAAAGFRTEPGGPWEGLSACTGLPGCGKSLADVRADAARTATAGGLPVHWSGCERRCGHPAGRWVDVLATGGGGYRVTVDGTARDVPGPGADDAEDDTELAAALAEARNAEARRAK